MFRFLSRNVTPCTESKLQQTEVKFPHCPLKFKIVNKGTFKEQEAGSASSCCSQQGSRVWWVQGYLLLAVFQGPLPLSELKLLWYLSGCPTHPFCFNCCSSMPTPLGRKEAIKDLRCSSPAAGPSHRCSWGSVLSWALKEPWLGHTGLLFSLERHQNNGKGIGKLQKQYTQMESQTSKSD